MSWIQENKFVAGLAGATAVIGGAILFFGVSQGSAYEKKFKQYKDLQGRYAQLEKAKPYPAESNLIAREDGIADYNKTIKEVRNLVAGYRPEKLEKMTPEQFKDIQVKMKADLYQVFEDAGTELPEDCLFGFERYDTASVKAGATAKLNYELGAIQWLMTKLAETKPVAITNIRRKELPEESGQVAQPAPRRGAKRGRAGRGSRGGQNNQVAAGRAYQLMPMELTFTASEPSVRKFLAEMVNSKNYYYSIRGIRVRNEKSVAPSHKDADFPADKAPVLDDGFGALEALIDDSGEGLDAAFAEESEESEEDAATDTSATGVAPVAPVIPDGELVLKQILGSEKLHVHLSFDIVLIEKKATSPDASSRDKESN